MTYRISPTLRSVLTELELGLQKRERAASEHAFDYTRDSRVELPNLESRGGPSPVLNPPEAGRSASSRLSR